MTRFLAGVLISLWAFPVVAEPQTLAQRYSSLVCAIVHIETAKGSGTGFFVDADGTVLTAAHVDLDRQYDATASAIVASLQKNVKIATADGRVVDIPATTLAKTDLENAGADLSLLTTGIKPPCFIPIETDQNVHIGDHLISIGFPGNAQLPVLYDGFLSSLRVQDPTILPVIGQQQIAHIPREVIRTQMPVTAGVSGSPLIDDNNRVLGAIVENPVIIPNDIASLVHSYMNGGPGTRMYVGGVDPNQMIAELSFVVTEFESSGAGYAVPVVSLHH